MIFKRFFAKFSNKRGIQDKRGMVINDFKRRRESKEVLKKIQNGEIKLKPKVNGVRKHVVNIETNNIKIKGDMI